MHRSRGRPPRARQRVLEILSFFPQGIRRSELLKRSGLSKRTVALVLNELVGEGIVTRRLGGYSELPSVSYMGPITVLQLAAQVATDIENVDLMRERSDKAKVPRLVLRKAEGKFLPRTPFYGLAPLSYGLAPLSGLVQ
jgi:hypothetical protein